jgi:thiol-disulfide isomerase/thioredoxin
LRVFILLLILVASSAVALSQEREKAPALVLRDLRGRPSRLSDYRGKVVLLNFWATWCPPCRAEVPDLVRWQREYRGGGLQVIGVTYPPTNLARVRRFVRRQRVNYPVLLGTHATKALFATGETLPMTIVVDREGYVRERIEGILLPDEFEEKVKPLLDEVRRR